MIPIVAINNLASIAICLTSFLILFKSYKTNKNQLIFDFTRFYFFLTLFFATYALPGLVLKNGTLIAIVFTLSNVFLFVSIAFFIRIPLEILKLTELKKLLFGICLFFAAYLTVLKMFIFKPAEIIKTDKFYDFTTMEPVWFSFLIGGLLGLIITLAIILFILEGLKSKDSTMKLKSFLISTGMIFLFLASMFNYVLYTILNYSLSMDILASISAWLGLLIILGGIKYKKFYFE